MRVNNLGEAVVVVTGAAGRLGSRMMQRFADQGASVAAIDQDPCRLPAGAPGQVFKANVTDETEVVAIFQQIGETFGAIDALVHTVGAWALREYLSLP